jgi:hypothetical protein
MNRELFLAILSMDSYNRGYGQGVLFNTGDSTSGQNEAGRTIGNATVIDVPLPAGSSASGFYGIAYDVSGAGVAGLTGTVISYRGSDSIRLPGDGFFSDALTRLFGGSTDNDVISGYGVAPGFPNGPQASLSIRFYRAVAEAMGATDLTSANITITGHSLGGGLAGLTAGIYNRPGFFVDPMPFGRALNNAFAMMGDGFFRNDPAFVSLVTGIPYSGPQLGAFTAGWSRQMASDFDGVVIPGRPEGVSNPYYSSNRLDAWRRVSGANIGAHLDDLDLPEDTPLGWFEINTVGQRHSIGTIIMRMYADQLGADNQQWRGVARFWMPSLYDQAFAGTLDVEKFKPPGTDATVAGTAGTDFFYITPGDHVITGGRGADYYFVGRQAGNDNESLWSLAA